MKKLSWVLRMNQILITSTTISLCKHLYRSYSFIVKRVSYIYHNSLTYGFINRFWEKIKICLRYSFLGKITETKQTTSGTLDNSRVVEHLFKFYNKWKDKIILCFKVSSTIDLAKDAKKDLYFFPVRIISIIVVTAITINVFLSIVLQKQISLWGWLIRGLLLFVSISGIFCKADWLTIKRSSVLLRKMRTD